MYPPKIVGGFNSYLLLSNFICVHLLIVGQKGGCMTENVRLDLRTYVSTGGSTAAASPFSWLDAHALGGREKPLGALASVPRRPLTSPRKMNARRAQRRRPGWLPLALALLALCSCNAFAAAVGGTSLQIAGTNVKLLVENAVGPSWIAWDSARLPNADLVYVDTDSWEIWVMDEHGQNRRCLTRLNDNILGVNFPLDEDGDRSAIHWKGDSEAHPTKPIIFFKAENANSAHRASRNSPSIGWDNDIWAINVETLRYTRLTNLSPGEGVQHSAMSHDGQWYVYPHRYDFGDPPRDFGYARMVFNELNVEENGEPKLLKRFEVEPNGKMYYEPIDIRRNPSGTYTLLYVAGSGNRLDPYRYDWTYEGGHVIATNTRLQNTPRLHEEFTMFSPGGEKIVWMRGPWVGLFYHADLYISNPDFTQVERLTWFNDCKKWSKRCKKGAQLSRLDWKEDGSAVFFGLWIHAPFRPANKTELYRIDLVPPRD